MDDAHKLVAAQNESHRREPDAAPFAVKREPRAMHRVQIQKLRRPLHNFAGHPVKFRFVQQKWNPRLIHKQRRAHRARGFGGVIGKAHEAVTDGRHNRGTAGAGMFGQHPRDKPVQPQHPRLLLIPPAAAKQDGRPLLRSAGRVLQFHQLVFQQRVQPLPGVQKIGRKIFAQLALANQRQAEEIVLRRRPPVNGESAPAREQFLHALQLRRFANEFRCRQHPPNTNAPTWENFQRNLI